MNKNIIIILVVGFVIAVSVALLVQASLGNATPRADMNIKRAEVLVATRHLRVGSELKPDDMQWQSWPEAALFDGAIIRQDTQEPHEALTGRLLRNIASGEPMMETALVPETRGNFMAASLGEGMRAISIPVSAATSAGGFVGPGDNVDIILTYEVRLRGEQATSSARTMVQRHASQTILEHVRVLAVDQEFHRDQDNAKVGRTVTVEVTPEQAEKLTLAITMGDLSLALRKLGDISKREQKSLTTDVAVSDVLSRMAREQRANGTAGGRIRVYSGGNVMNVPVRAVPR